MKRFFSKKRGVMKKLLGCESGEIKDEV